MQLFITRKGSPIICRMLPVSLFLSLSYKYIPTALVRLVVHSCLVRTNSVRNASTDRVLQRTCDKLKKMRWTLSVKHTLYCVPLIGARGLEKSSLEHRICVKYCLPPCILYQNLII
jgi:hypothetical protein